MAFRIVYDPRNLALADSTIVTPIYEKPTATSATVVSGQAAMLAALGAAASPRVSAMRVRVPGVAGSYDISPDMTVIEIDGQYFALPDMDAVDVIKGGEKDVTLGAVNLSTGEPVALGRFIDKDDLAEFGDRHPLTLTRYHSGKFDRESQIALDTAKTEVDGNKLLGRDAHAFVVNGQLYFIMPRLPGRDLMACYEEGSIASFDFDDRLAAARHLAGQVAVVHLHGYIFGDLSPENVKLINGILNLFDFGSAKRATELRVGSADKDLYSDEHSLRTGFRDARSDLFALSVILGMLFPEVFKLEVVECKGKGVAHVAFRDDLPVDHEHRANPFFQAIVAMNDVAQREEWPIHFATLVGVGGPAAATDADDAVSVAATPVEPVATPQRLTGTPVSLGEATPASTPVAPPRLGAASGEVPNSEPLPTPASARLEGAAVSEEVLNLASVPTPPPPRARLGGVASASAASGRPPGLSLRLPKGAAAEEETKAVEPAGGPPGLRLRVG